MSEPNAPDGKAITLCLSEFVQCTLQLPQSAIDKLSAGERWRGGIVITPLRKGLATELQAGPPKRSITIVRATVDERRIIRAWNRSRYIKALESKPPQLREDRNNPVHFKEIIAVLPFVKRAIKVIGTAEVIRGIESYFDFCMNGGHIWEGRSHGFKSLAGFLEKILALEKEKKVAWWDSRATPTRIVVDDNVRLTKRIADSFAQTFMGEDQYPMEEGSKEHAHFSRTAAQMVRFISRKQSQGLTIAQAEMIKYLLEFVDDLFAKQGDVVYPGHLSSSSVWSALPQYLKDRGVL